MNKGRFGIHGGQFIPETLMNAVMDLEEAYNRYRQDPDFVAELDGLLREYAGRPSLLYYAEKMTRDLGGAKIYLKREDLNHTGSHKLNNVLGQVLLLSLIHIFLVILYNFYRGCKEKYLLISCECQKTGLSGKQGGRAVPEGHTQ